MRPDLLIVACMSIDLCAHQVCVCVCVHRRPSQSICPGTSVRPICEAICVCLHGSQWLWLCACINVCVRMSVYMCVCILT